MRKGTTPTFTFELPFSIDIVKKAKFMLKQNDAVLVKYLEDATTDNNSLTWRLNAEETMKFGHNVFCLTQIQVITNHDESLVSEIYSVSVSEYLDKEVMT